MRALNSKPALWAVWGMLAAWGLAEAAPKPADTVDQDTNFDNVEMADGSLKGKIAVLRVGTEPSPNNLLSVFVGLKNKTDGPLTLEIETIYKDNDGKPLNSGSWVAIAFKPHEEREYRSTSISQAFDNDSMNAHFLIRIRRAAAHR